MTTTDPSGFLIPQSLHIEIDGSQKAEERIAWLAQQRLSSLQAPTADRDVSVLNPATKTALLWFGCVNVGSDSSILSAQSHPYQSYQLAIKSNLKVIIISSDTFFLFTIKKCLLFAIMAMAQVIFYKIISSAAAILLTYQFQWVHIF